MDLTSGIFVQLVWSFSPITALYKGTREPEKFCLCESFALRLS